MPEFKRPADVAMVPPVSAAKRARVDNAVQVLGQPPRTSNLQAPIMLLQGHEGEIYAAKFSLDGSCIASVGFDMRIFLWNVYGDCENFSVLKGHSGAIMDVHFSTDSSFLFTASVDKSIRVWDMEVGNIARKFRGHGNFVNSCHPARRGPQLVCSGSDDGTVKVWDVRKREAVHTFQNTYQVTAVTFNDTSDMVVSGGIDNVLKVWDLRKNAAAYVMPGHIDTVTGLSLSPNGNFVLSNSMDGTARIWDVQPFTTQPQRCINVFEGHQHNFEKNLLRCCWSANSNRISCGSSDRFVYIWDVKTRKLVYKLPGHQGSVNATDFHPNEPIVLSAGSDKRIYLGEID